jgi:nucleoside-diphosphate-sugar epimerase
MKSMPKKKKPASHRSHSSSHLPTALVAGAAGFIGSHLCDTLLLQNCKVYAIDNWSTGKKQNINHLLKKDNFVFLEHDLNKPFESPIPPVDYIFHLAGIEAYLNGLDVSLETLLVNSLGTRELLEVAKKQKAKFLLASTTDIFSGFLSSSDLAHYFGADRRQQEAYSHHEAKRFSEALTFEYVNRHHLDARIARLGNVYGPRLDLKAGNDIVQLFVAVKQNQPLKITGQGLKQLYPTYISDIIYGLTKAMFSQSSQNHIYTLVNPDKITLLNFAYKLKESVPDKDLKIEFVSGANDIATLTLSDEILNSQKELGWIPKITLKEGIAKTLKWLDSGQVSILPSEKELEAATEEPTYTPEDLGLKPAPSVAPPSKSSKAAKKLKLPKITLRLPKPKLNLPFKKGDIKLSLKPKPGSKKLSTRTKLIIATASFILIYLFGPLILMTAYAYTAINSLRKASQLADYSQVSKLEKLTTRAEKNFGRSRQLLRRSHLTTSLLGLKDLITNLDRLFFIGTKLSQGTHHLAQAGEAGTLLTQIIFHHQDGNISQALKRIQINLDQAYSELSFVESELQSGQELNLDLTTPLTQKFQKLTSDLPAIRQKINQARLILPLIPSFIAQDSKKTYLLLFQNSAEIRPTGGFIGSYGLLVFDQGKLLDFTIEDIYSADGQLKGYVKPPEPIEEFLGQNTWYFRDSNWDPDFTISAERAEWFLNKTTSRKVDGVIAVNLPAVKEFLKATGPIDLPDYNEEITADNLFERAEYRSEIDFFAGSTQKKDFLGALAREIFDKAQNSSATDLLKYVQALEVALTQKQILVYLHDSGSQKLLLEQNWAGALFTPRLATLDNRPVLSDYAYLVEANLGINKANYFLKRHIQQQLTIFKTKQTLSITTISYHNQSPADAWPGGVYRSYLREYIPANSKLIAVKVADKKLNLKKDIDQQVVGNKTIIGFPVTVPVKTTLDVEITYRLPTKLEFANLPSGKQARLAMVIPKQPGIIDDTLEVIINHPSFLTVAAVNPQALISPQVVTFQSDLTLDRVFTIDFIQQ